MEFETRFRLYPTYKHQRFRILEDELLQIVPEEYQKIGISRRGNIRPIYEDVFYFANFDKFFVTGTNLLSLSNVGDRFYLLVFDYKPKKIVQVYNQKFYRLK